MSQVLPRLHSGGKDLVPLGNVGMGGMHISPGPPFPHLSSLSGQSGRDTESQNMSTAVRSVENHWYWLIEGSCHWAVSTVSVSDCQEGGSSSSCARQEQSGPGAVLGWTRLQTVLQKRLALFCPIIICLGLSSKDQGVQNGLKNYPCELYSLFSTLVTY